MSSSKQTAFRLTKRDLELLKRLQLKLGIRNRTDLVRFAISKLAELEGISVKTYNVSYSRPTTLSPEDHQTLIMAEENPSTLEEVVETCQLYRVDAELTDQAGFKRGWIHADGNYRLT